MGIVTICLVVYLGIISWCDYKYGLLAQPLACLNMMLIGLVITLPGLRIIKTRRISAGLSAVFIVMMIALHFVSFSPVKSFKRLFYNIQPGMSRSAVQKLIANSFPANSKNYVACFPLSRPDNEGDDMECVLRPHGTLNESIEVDYKNRIVVQAILRTE
jgi:prepilin signal peptidase PulO-like enzyme (type II secretory pathway)